MKDIVLKGRTLSRELIVLAVCFAAVNLWNVYAIVRYDTSWSELYSVWYAVLFVTGIVYVLLIPLRLLGRLLFRLGKKAACRRSPGK